MTRWRRRSTRSSGSGAWRAEGKPAYTVAANAERSCVDARRELVEIRGIGPSFGDSLLQALADRAPGEACSGDGAADGTA